MSFMKCILPLCVTLCGSISTAVIAADQPQAPRSSPTAPSSARHADDIRPGDWPAFGRTADDWHYSPLTEINTAAVGGLKLAWFFDIPGTVLSLSTPLEVDGVLYCVTGYGVLRALDARSGRLIWSYDPRAFQAAGPKQRLNWGTRGIAYWSGKIYEGLVDGRLIAVDARSGTLSWSVATGLPHDTRSITGPPRLFDGKVIIGHGGGDVGAMRGYVTAYDAETGRQLWRFFTVPGNPAHGFENKAMERAAKTWSGQWWRFGGGGAVWNAISYDPELRRIYIGTGNGLPWNPKIRSPKGGDNLYVCSIVALSSDTGAYLWHYQTTPGDAWDFDATQDIELATLTVNGKHRRVLMQASKNGFFYVIDRDTGKLISAEKYTKVTWATRIDPKTGRPIEDPSSRYREHQAMVWPGNIGARNWQPMSFSPRTGLVYIPTFDIPGLFDDRGVDIKSWQPPSPTSPNTGLHMGNGTAPTEIGISALIAWDPAKEKEAWHIPLSAGWHGGTLATAGDLVFQGRADGQFLAYAAHLGGVLWSFDAQAGIIGAPISYEVEGHQYVSVMVGYTGPAGAFGDLSAQYGWQALSQQRRVLAFSLDGHAALPVRHATAPLTAFDDPSYVANPAEEATGSSAYANRCIWCHGGEAIAGGHARDLRTSSVVPSAASFRSIVQDGALQDEGMPIFSDVSASELESIRQYLRGRAHQLRGEPGTKNPAPTD